MTAISQHLTDDATILPYQQPVFKKLCAVARASLFINRKQFKVLTPRTNFFLIGPSGSGKTHLAKEVARSVGVPFFSVSVSDWIILGNANGGANNTWPLIVQFILKNITKQGVIIFIDELDKCSCKDEGAWNIYLRSEIFSLSDSNVCISLKDSESDNQNFKDHEIALVEDFLKYRTMIIGGAAFQNIWEEQNAPSMGFNANDHQDWDAPQLANLASYLPRELVNRFSSQLFILPQLKKKDYRDMIYTMAVHVPYTWRNRFIEIGLSNLDLAVSDQKGARYAEEVLLSAIVDVGVEIKKEAPKEKAPVVEGIEFKNADEVIKIF